MSLLFADPLGFLPGADVASTSSSSSGLRSLFHQWNQTLSARAPPPGTFNNPALPPELETQQMEQLEQLTGRMDSLQQSPSSPASSKDRTLNARRIKQPAKAQLVEPIPVLDMDHPLNSWMLNSNTDHLGPLATKNSSDWPVLPQFTVSALSNGTLVQIPVRISRDAVDFQRSRVGFHSAPCKMTPLRRGVRQAASLNGPDASRWRTGGEPKKRENERRLLASGR